LIQQGRRRVQLDLAQLQFIDAAGLEALLEAHNAMLSAAGELLIINVQPRTHRLLELTGLEQVLDVAEPQ
jgi:anti-anti-sigma factor